MTHYVAEYDQTYIGWSGATTLDDENTYIRVDGPGVWIEFSNQAGIVLDESTTRRSTATRPPTTAAAEPSTAIPSSTPVPGRPRPITP